MLAPNILASDRALAATFPYICAVQLRWCLSVCQYLEHRIHQNHLICTCASNRIPFFWPVLNRIWLHFFYIKRKLWNSPSDFEVISSNSCFCLNQKVQNEEGVFTFVTISWRKVLILDTLEQATSWYSADWLTNSFVSGDPSGPTCVPSATALGHRWWKWPHLWLTSCSCKLKVLFRLHLLICGHNVSRMSADGQRKKTGKVRFCCHVTAARKNNKQNPSLISYIWAGSNLFQSGDSWTLFLW